MFNKIGSIAVKLSSFANDAGILSTSAEQIDIKKIQDNLDIFDEKLEQYYNERQTFKDKMKELKDE